MKTEKLSRPNSFASIPMPKIPLPGFRACIGTASLAAPVSAAARRMLWQVDGTHAQCGEIRLLTSAATGLRWTFHTGVNATLPGNPVLFLPQSLLDSTP
ncbi:hypothetical protein LBMAG56_08610 [Verrucomicrobiota bacterium]|nr:hypothetical protein LBMAG56_08610 [Verrucomicrobiota bacterium]